MTLGASHKLWHFEVKGAGAKKISTNCWEKNQQGHISLEDTGFYG